MIGDVYIESFPYSYYADNYNIVRIFLLRMPDWIFTSKVIGGLHWDHSLTELQNPSVEEFYEVKKCESLISSIQICEMVCREKEMDREPKMHSSLVHFILSLPFLARPEFTENGGSGTYLIFAGNYSLILIRQFGEREEI